MKNQVHLLALVFALLFSVTPVSAQVVYGPAPHASHRPLPGTVIGYLQARPEDTSKVYDYCACLYPEAYQDANHLYLFNHDQIQTVYSVGYIDEEHLSFIDRLDQTARTLPG